MTRARIGLQFLDGSFISVYHHDDGYPEWLGRVLQRYFSSLESVESLIRGGDMRSCWSNRDFDGFVVNKDTYRPLYYSL